MGDIGAPELIIIGIIIVLLFGATRLPATAKGLGQALRLFKKEIRADDEPAKPTEPVAPTAQLTSTPVEVPQPVVVQSDTNRVVTH